MTEAEFAEILARGRELRNVEHKGPGLRTDRRYLARVARAALGMANLRDGGLVTIGVADDNGIPVAVGLTAEQRESWSRYEVTAASLGPFAQPSLSFDLELLSYRGVDISLLRVREFDDIPLLCAEEVHDENDRVIVRRGAMYVRSQRRLETAEVPTQDEMREVLALAIEKGVRRFVELGNRVGFVAGPAPEGDVARYDAELEEP